MGRREFLLGGIFFAAAGKGEILQHSQSTRLDIPATIEDDIGFIKGYPFQNLSSWITPVEQFFVRNHFVQPEIDLKNWKLAVEGDVERTLYLSYDDLLGFSVETSVVTLECTGNPVGGQMVSTGKWSGVPLRNVLERAKIKPGAREVILEGADEGFVTEWNKSIRFARSIPLSKAIHPATLLAHTVNDVKLPPALGFPLRAIVPGYYAANSVKWLTRIIITTEPFRGFFNSRRYIFIRKEKTELDITPAYEIRVKSQIARPINNTLLSRRPYTIHGAAWSGEAEITAVEVTLDGGQSWKAADLGNDRAPYAWRLWKFLWPDPQPGTYLIGCRAVDSKGRSQPAKPDPEELTAYGNNSIHWVKVTVR